MSASDQPRAASGDWLPRALADSHPDSGTRRLSAGVVAVLGGAVAIFAICSGLGKLAEVEEWMAAPLVYQKDFLAGYLLAWAMIKGIDPFLPLNVLSVLYFDRLPAPFFSHPTPHPPTLGLLFYPLTLLDYLTAARLWLWLEFAFLFGAFTVLARELRLRYPALWALVLTPSSLLWFPITHELQRGQVSILLLLILAGSWVALRAGHRLRCGLLLGLALLIKPIVWPCAIVLLMRKDWRALFSAMGVTGLGYLAAAWAIGLDSLVLYFVKIGPEVSADYYHWAWNLSLWTIGHRLFEGTQGITSPPLFLSHLAASLTAVALPALVLLLALYVIWRRRVPLDAAFAGTIGVSLMVNPVAWPHYLVIALIPLAQVILWLVKRRLPGPETGLALLSVALLALGDPDWQALAFRVAGRSSALPWVLPLAPSLVMLGPAVAVIFVSLLALYLEGKRSGRQASSSARDAVESLPASLSESARSVRRSERAS